MDLYKSSIYRIFKDASERKILICGHDENAMRIYKKLCLIDVLPAGFLVSSPLIRGGTKSLSDEFKKVSSKSGMVVYTYEDLKNININEIRILITKAEQAKELEALGLCRGRDFRSVAYHESLRQEYKLDPTMGYNLLTDIHTPGFKKFGNEQSDNLIVTLGNSTTDPVLFPFKSWSELLGERINRENADLKILCGAVSGHTSAQELLKLIRDVVPMHPKMVICYEGFQDMNIAFENRSFRFILPYQKEWMETFSSIDKWIGIYYTKGYMLGMDDDLSCYQIWKRNMRFMYAVCQEFGIRFIGILQPSIFNKYPDYQKEDWEVVLHYELRGAYFEWFKKFFDEYKEDTEKLEYVYDYTDIFNDIDGIYIDNCHICEQGNSIVADRIWNDFLEVNSFTG